MSSRLSRPRRTKVYDCNYNMGERYYKPVVDDLDRKYTGRGAISDAAAAADASIASLRSTFGENENSLSASLRRSAARAIEDTEDTELTRRRPMSALLADYDSIFDSRTQSSNMSKTRDLLASTMDDDSEDAAITKSLKRLRAARAARADIEEEVSTTTTTTRRRPITEFSEKVLDTVGLKKSDIGKARLALAEDEISKRVLKMTTSDEGENPSWTKWSKFGEHEYGEEDFDSGSASRARKVARERMAALEAEIGEDRAAEAAKERARKSRARLADIEAEMEAIADKGAARERRAANLRAFLQENEANADSSSSVSAKSSMRIKKISSTVQSEKKAVTF